MPLLPCCWFVSRRVGAELEGHVTRVMYQHKPPRLSIQSLGGLALLPARGVRGCLPC